MGGEKEGEAVASFLFGSRIIPREAEQKEAPIVRELHRYVREAGWIFNVPFINLSLYLVSL